MKIVDITQSYIGIRMIFVQRAALLYPTIRENDSE